MKSGAFYTPGLPHLIHTLSGGSNFGGEYFYFEASRYNAIFGSCNTVMPASADISSGIFDNVTKMKYDVPNDHIEAFDDYFPMIDKAVNESLNA